MKAFLIAIATLFLPFALILGFIVVIGIRAYTNENSTMFFLLLISFLLCTNISVVCMVGVGIIGQLEKASPKTTPAPADSKSTAAGSSPYEGHAPAWVTPYETGAEIPAYLRAEDTERGPESVPSPCEEYAPAWVAPDETGAETPDELHAPAEKDLKPPKKKKKSKK